MAKNDMKNFYKNNNVSDEELTDLIKYNQDNKIPVNLKNKDNINIVFCFDEKQYMQAGVSITSLLYSSLGKCSYNIYCIIPDSVDELKQNDLSKIVKEQDINSTITFIKIDNTFKNSYTSRHLSQATYFRLKIHELLPHLDKIIYCDVDIIFCKDLIEMDNIDIGDNLIGGILDCDMLDKCVFKNWYINNSHNKLDFDLKSLYLHCINAGILIMNLYKIRKDKLYNKWQNLLKYKFYLHDQDILNISCYKQIKYIDPKFNILVHTINKKLNYGINYKEKLDNAVNNPVIIHFTTGEKPWLCKPNKFFDNWWYMASKTPFYEVLSLNYLRLNLKNNIQCNGNPTSPNLRKYKCYLFGLLPCVIIKYYNNKIKYYLFGIILILKIKEKKVK